MRQKIALGIGLGVLGLAITLRVAGAPRLLLMSLHLFSLAACLFAILARDKAGSEA